MAVVLPPLAGGVATRRARSMPRYIPQLADRSMQDLSDRFGVIVPVLVGSVSLGFGFIAASFSQNLLQFTAIHGC